jgi:hypothetical protein
MSSDEFARFKAAYERPMPEAPDLPTPSKGGNGPRFAAVAAPVQHVAGTLEAFVPRSRAKRPAGARGRSVAPAVLPAPLPTDAEALKRLIAFATEREAVRLRKESGQPEPWTADPILAARKFCNVRREDDAVDRWAAANWRAPHRDDPDVWFALTVACLINEPETLTEIGYPVPFDWPRVRGALLAREARGAKIWRGVYKSVMARAGQSRIERLGEILSPLWHDREQLRPQAGDTLAGYADRLRDYDGIGPFMAAQVVARLKHVAPLNTAPDWWTFALPGDGSVRGLNRVRKRTQESKTKNKKWDKKWPEWLWHLELTRLAAQVAEAFAAAGLPRLDMQNLQNVLCEFDKYERTRETSQIPPSQRYKPAPIAPAPQPKKPAKTKRVKSSEATPEPRATTAEPETETEQHKAGIRPQTPEPPESAEATPPPQRPEPPEPVAVTSTSPQSPEPRCLAAALDYATRFGWKVFPAMPGTKKSYKSAAYSGGERWGATRDPEQIRRDFTRWPEALIGIPTGPDNGFWVLEIDTTKGGHAHDGFAALAALIAQHGALPATLTAESPSGSWHYYFRWLPSLEIRNRANWPAPGVDIRGEGGMVIAPPSLRADGAYRWINFTEAL